MARREQNQDLSMDRYFNERLSEDIEPHNPFAEAEEQPPKKKKKRPANGQRKSGQSSGKKKKRVVNRKRIMGLLGTIVGIVAVICIVVFILHRKNDGARYARLLSQEIGVDINVAQKKVGLTMQSESNYPTLNSLYRSFQTLAESKKKCMVSGVRLPEWAIFCNTNADELTNVTYYNYEVLEKHIFGTQRKAYIDPSTLPVAATREQVEAGLDLEPYLIQYLQGKTEQREYRYCYKDGDTGDMVSYVIVAVWDESGHLTSITDYRRNYIGTLLSSPQPG